MNATTRSVVILASVAIAVAVISTTMISQQLNAFAGPIVVNSKLSAIKAPPDAEYYQNPVKRALFVSLPQPVLDNNPKLKEVITKADSLYEIRAAESTISKTRALATVDLKQSEVNTLLSILPQGEVNQDIQGEYVVTHQYFHLDISGNLYDMTITTVGTQ